MQKEEDESRGEKRQRQTLRMIGAGGKGWLTKKRGHQMVIKTLWKIQFVVLTQREAKVRDACGTSQQRYMFLYK